MKIIKEMATLNKNTLLQIAKTQYKTKACKNEFLFCTEEKNLSLFFIKLFSLELVLFVNIPSYVSKINCDMNSLCNIELSLFCID